MSPPAPFRPLRIRLLLLAGLPPASLLVALALWCAAGKPWSPVLPLLLAVLALGAALAFALALDGRVRTDMESLDEGLRHLGAARFAGLPVRAGLFKGTPALLDQAATALEARERALRAFGPEVEPSQSVAWLASLEAPALERGAVVLQARWLDADAALAALEPAARLSGLGRFYECVLEALRLSGGRVLEFGGAQVLAAWDAPVADSGAQGGSALAPLRCAWQLRARLSVLASQHRLRHGAPLDWSLALAEGPLVRGAWGPRDKRRWAWSGLPLAEVRALSARPGGPWLGGTTAESCSGPYGVQQQEGLFLLVSGQE